MKIATLDRNISKLSFGTHQIPVIELPWRDNKPHKSCIPKGVYIVRRDYTGRFQYYRVQDVPNRTFIEIHLASDESELEGCIGVYHADDMRKLKEWTGEDSFLLNIT